jgi:phospholipid/cholesterol/gamma-HCH transport system ATP-binding protein
METGALVELSHVAMAFGNRPVFGDLSCTFPAGRISVVLGGSGSGKSTLLRLIGGLVRPQSGHILVDGEDVTTLSEDALFRVRRKLGMLFQGGALLDSMTVFDNLALPLREHERLDRAAVAAAVHDRLEAVGLRDVDALLPSQLSGGMVKRVSLARAIIRNPAVLLCDEPFSGLDPISSKRIETLLVNVSRSRGITTVVVSHDIDSTMRMAEHVLLLLPGGYVHGAPAELRASDDPRVRAFLSDDVDAALALPEAS